MALDRSPSPGGASRLGNYELLKELSGGGVGSTWLARSSTAKDSADLVTIFRLYRHLTKKAEVADGVLKAAEVAGKVRSPNVLGVLDARIADGEVFVVSEYAEGEALAALLTAAGVTEAARAAPSTTNPLPTSVVLRMGLDMLHALAAAHTATPDPIVHGELNPHHIRVGVDGVTRVGGFGIARAVAGLAPMGGKNHDRLAYAAPERVKAMSQHGDAPLDPRADLFSIGVILWEAIAKQRLFSSKLEAAIIQKVLTAPVPSLSSIDGVEAPAALETALQKALERDPERRFASAEEMIAALDAIGAENIASAADVASAVEKLASKTIEARKTMIAAAMLGATPGEARAPRKRGATLVGVASPLGNAAGRGGVGSRLAITAPVPRQGTPAASAADGAATGAAPEGAATGGSERSAIKTPPAAAASVSESSAIKAPPAAAASVSESSAIKAPATQPASAQVATKQPASLNGSGAAASGKTGEVVTDSNDDKGRHDTKTDIMPGPPAGAVSDAEVAAPAVPARPPAASPSATAPDAPPIRRPAPPRVPGGSPRVPGGPPRKPAPPVPPKSPLGRGAPAPPRLGSGKRPLAPTAPDGLAASRRNAPTVPVPSSAAAMASAPESSKTVEPAPISGLVAHTPTPTGPQGLKQRGPAGSAVDRLGPGSTLGRYEILMPVAKGGMAAVWAARLQGTRGFQKIVAIKTMLPDVSDDPDFQTMFLDEARVAARIRHPNVAEILDLGEEDEVLYLVMEWVDGETLSTLQKAAKPLGGIPQRIAIRIASQICAGLHNAHELRDDAGNLVDLVHRDVSPANVLVSTAGFVKIVDFGVAKSKGRLHVTRAGGVVKGKTPYLSPEQLGGLAIDRRSDIFSLGALLYVLTTGLHPFRGETEMATVENIALKNPIPPHDLNDKIPPEFEKVILKALEKDRAMRFASCAEMQRAIDQVASTLGEPTTDEDVADFVRRAIGSIQAKRAQDLRDAITAVDAGVLTDIKPPAEPPVDSTPSSPRGALAAPPVIRPAAGVKAVPPPPPPVSGEIFDEISIDEVVASRPVEHPPKLIIAPSVQGQSADQPADAAATAPDAAAAASDASLAAAASPAPADGSPAQAAADLQAAPEADVQATPSLQPVDQAQSAASTRRIAFAVVGLAAVLGAILLFAVGGDDKKPEHLGTSETAPAVETAAPVEPPPVEPPVEPPPEATAAPTEEPEAPPADTATEETEPAPTETAIAAPPVPTQKTAPTRRTPRPPRTAPATRPPRPPPRPTTKRPYNPPGI